LKYCPYGPLVEHFPLSPEARSYQSVSRRYRHILRLFAKGTFKKEDEILDAIDWLEYHWPGRWKYIQHFDTAELECSVFGHICPVFLTAETWATETKHGRRHTRHIPRDVMLKVVRRDGSTCQLCFKPVPDNEIDFDHIIPHSRGGQTTVHNLRVLCRSCNSRKRDSLGELLDSNSMRPNKRLKLTAPRK
jgi:hypothetical protein